MLKKKITTLLITAALLTSVMPAAFADTTEQPPQIPTQSQGEQPPAKPDGDQSDGEQPPQMPNGEQSQGDMNVSIPFTDVASDAWYYNVVSQAYGKGLISGMSDTEFSPESSVTGAQLIMMLYRADGNTVSEQTSGNWYDEAVDWAKEKSIISDNNGWTFDANTDLTREQMMLLLYNYLQYKGNDLSALDDLSSYTDSSEISAYAENAVKALVGKGIIEGDGETLRPLSSLTRAETAVILINAVDSGNPGGNQGGMQPPSGNMPGGNAPGGFGGSGTVTQGTSATTITEDGTYSSTSYTSTGDDENALRVDGATVTLDSVTVDKSAGSSSNTEDGDFYGQNAALLATNGANVTIKNATVNSSAQNGNGIFSYGAGTTVNVSDSTITTTADNSGGIQTTGGGTTNATNLTVNTSGNSAAAIRSDRGGGTVVVDKGTYTSNGYNSPAVYSTADITVSNANLTANNSESLVIEGKNSIKLNNCDVSGNMSSTEGSSSDENVHNVMIYQSMSGDAEVGTSEFDMTGGSLTGNNGDMFYITNTHSIINLSNVDITNKDADAYLMRVTGNSAARGWGKAGANGAQVEFTASNQTLNGNIAVDTVSTLNMTLTDSSDFTGTINIIDNAQNGTAVDNNAVVTIDSDSTWTLTGDCTVTSLENNGTINFNGHTITLADGTVLSK